MGSNAALQQLVAIGIQGQHLTINPETSLFKSTYKRHSHYSTNFNKFKNNNVTVTREGDLVNLHLLLESHLELSKYELLEFIQSFSVRIGGSDIIYLLIKNESFNISKCYNDESDIVYHYTLKVPLISLAYHDIKVILQKKEYNQDQIIELIQKYEGTTNISTIWREIPSVIVSKILKELEDIDIYYKNKYTVNAKLGCEYIYLDNQERTLFAQNPHPTQTFRICKFKD